MPSRIKVLMDTMKTTTPSDGSDWGRWTVLIIRKCFF
jgi:hypothetical protein